MIRFLVCLVELYLALMFTIVIPGIVLAGWFGWVDI